VWALTEAARHANTGGLPAVSPTAHEYLGQPGMMNEQLTITGTKDR
jgi:hypothetical protein